MTPEEQIVSEIKNHLKVIEADLRRKDEAIKVAVSALGNIEHHFHPPESVMAREALVEIQKILESK